MKEMLGQEPYDLSTPSRHDMMTGAKRGLKPMDPGSQPYMSQRPESYPNKTMGTDSWMDKAGDYIGEGFSGAWDEMKSTDWKQDVWDRARAPDPRSEEAGRAVSAQARCKGTPSVHRATVPALVVAPRPAR
jgi:hypothetical protein